MSKLFYLQDSRQYVGNDMLWWAHAGGYTTDLSKAALFGKPAAQAKHDCRPSDIPWPKEYIDSKVRPAVDMQYVKRKEVGDGGIVLAPPVPKPRDTHQCGTCHKFITQVQYYGTDGYCEKCA